MYEPRAVPVALLVWWCSRSRSTPLQNVVVAHVEAEADWVALQTTRDPRRARELFEELAETSHTEPRAARLGDVLFDTHPTIMERIEMVEAWRGAHGRPRG